MRIDPEQIDVMNRGGRPTLAELEEHLVFRPLDASIQLAGARMMLQRASIAIELRDALVARHGAHSARVTLMTLGYRAGIADARFIREAWPNINVGDAFTAGTRLHMLSGTVAVETIGNDFDFERGRYASEFLWRNSVEATEYHRVHGRASEPVCWMQLGYASGYASHFFRRLVVYKEKHCSAMGHRHCHLQGGTVDRWGEDDPLVRLFRDEIISAPSPRHDRVPPAAAAPDEAGADTVAGLVLAPVAARIERVARAQQPALFAGPGGSGRRIAAQAFVAHAVPGIDVRRIHGSSPDVQELFAALFGKPGRRCPRNDVWQLDEIEWLAPHQQAALADHLAASRHEPRLIAATTSCSEPGERLRADLFHAFVPIRLPGFAARPDIARIAQAVAADLATELGRSAAVLSQAAVEALSLLRLPGNLPELRALVREAILDTDGPEIGAGRFCVPLRSGDDEAPTRALDAALVAGRIDVDRLSLDLCRKALEVSDGNVSAAARLIGLSRAQLDYRLRDRRHPP
jgi:predicted hydrocarbon binding protein